MRVGSSNKKESKPNGPHAPIAIHPLLMLKGEWGSEYITFRGFRAWGKEYGDYDRGICG